MFRKLAVCAVLAVAGFGVAGCGTTPVTLAYTAPAVARPPAAKPEVEVFTVSDSRKNASNQVGVIRGGFGNPLKTLESSMPVRDVVRQAFVDGLAARGLLAQGGGGRYGLEVVIERLDSSQLVRREAHARFLVSVFDKSAGRQVYSRTAEDNRADSGSLVEVGVFGSVEELRKLVNESLQGGVDQALDNPAFLTVIGAR